MSKPDLFKLIINVICSWQVILITIALVLYLKIVSYAAGINRSSMHKAASPKQKRKEAPPKAEVTEEGTNADLGLEDEEEEA